MKIKYFIYHDMGYNGYDFLEFETEDQARQYINDNSVKGCDIENYRVVKGLELKIEPENIITTVRFTEKVSE